MISATTCGQDITVWVDTLTGALVVAHWTCSLGAGHDGRHEVFDAEGQLLGCTEGPPPRPTTDGDTP